MSFVRYLTSFIIITGIYGFLRVSYVLLYHLNNSGREKRSSGGIDGVVRSSKSVSQFLPGPIASVFAQGGDTIHVVSAQEAAR